MNQGRLWTVVSPTVGLPLFLGTVAVTSLLVHFAILSHTTWFPAFFQGGTHKVAMDTSAPVSLGTPAYTVSITG